MELLRNNGFKFCPSCGSQELQFTLKNMCCRNCGFTYYQNTAAGVGAIISRRSPNEEGLEVLLVVRAQAPEQGRYDLPGGFVDPAENLEGALLRELEEELGHEICSTLSPPKYLVSCSNSYHYKGNSYIVCDVFFSAELMGQVELIAADDVQAYLWCRVQDLEFEHIAFPSTRAALKLWLGL